jgi:hypothetical protein
MVKIFYSMTMSVNIYLLVLSVKKQQLAFNKTYAAMDQAIRQTAAMGSVLEIIPLAMIQQDGHEPLAVVRHR